MIQAQAQPIQLMLPIFPVPRGMPAAMDKPRPCPHAPHFIPRWATPERIGLTAIQRARNRQWRTIYPLVVAMPGPVPTMRDLIALCAAMGIRSPQQEAKADRMRKARQNLRQLGAAPTLDSRMMHSGTDTIHATLDEARAWAGKHGIRFNTWEDLRWLNQQRERMGLLGIARKFSQSGLRK